MLYKKSFNKEEYQFNKNNQKTTLFYTYNKVKNYHLKNA